MSNLFHQSYKRTSLVELLRPYLCPPETYGFMLKPVNRIAAGDKDRKPC